MGGPMEISEATEDSQSVALKGLIGNLSSTGYLDVADEELTALFGPPYVSQVAGDHQSIVFFQAVSDFCYGACRAADYLENSRC